MQELNCHNRFTELFTQAAALPLTTSEWLFVHRLLTRVEQGLTLGGEANRGDTQCAGQKVERFPAQQTEHNLSFFLGGEPLGLLPPMLAPLSSRSTSSLRGDLDGYLLWLHLDTSST